MEGKSGHGDRRDTMKIRDLILQNLAAEKRWRMRQGVALC